MSTHARVAQLMARPVIAGGGGGGTPATFVASTSASGSLTVTKPTGALVGDKLFVMLNDDNTRTISGFTSLMGTGYNFSGIFGQVAVFYRVLDGSEGTTFTLSGSLSGNGSVHLALLYRGGGTPGLLNATQNEAGGSNRVSRAVAPVAGTMIHFYSDAPGTSSPVLTAPGSGVTMRKSQGGSWFAALAADESVVAGDDVTRTATSNKSGGGMSATILLPNTGQMVPSFPATATANGNSAAPAVTVPTATQVGDLIVILASITGASITSGVSGFTAIEGPGSVSGQPLGYWWGWKIATAADIGAVKSLVSGSQVWAVTCVIVRNVAGTPVTTLGTAVDTTSSPLTVANVGASVPAIALTGFFEASGSPSGGSVVNSSSVAGMCWLYGVNGGSGYGCNKLGVSAVPSGSNSLAPSVTAVGGAVSVHTNAVIIPLAPEPAVTTYDQAVLADFPAMYLKLADVVGTTNPVVDSSGNGRNALVQSTVTFGSAALVTSDAQTSAQIASGSPGRIERAPRDIWTATATEYTVEAIYKPTTLPTQATLVGIDDNGSSLKWRLESNNTGVLFMEWKESGGTYRSLSSAAGVLVAGTKAHIALTYKVSGGAFLYVNGVQVASSGITQTALFDSSSANFIIGAIASNGLPMNGLIGRVAVYATQLSAARIAAHAALV